MDNKNFSGFIKVLQIASGILMLGMVILCIVLMNKYNIKVTNIPQLAGMIQGGTVAIAAGIIAFSVIKSFALIFPPAVVFSICGYLMPDYFTGLAVNLISVFLSLSIPWFLGKFTGAGMVDTLKSKFKAVKKIDDFAGANETQMTFVVKMSGILPGDLSSLLFGAMNISYKNYMIGANLGNLPLVIVYTGFGVALRSVGEKPWLAAIPVLAIIFFVIISGIITKKMIAKNNAAQKVN